MKRIDFDKLEEAVLNGTLGLREADEYKDWDSEDCDGAADDEMEDISYNDHWDDDLADCFPTRNPDIDEFGNETDGSGTVDCATTEANLARYMNSGDNAFEVFNDEDGTIEIKGAGGNTDDFDLDERFNRDLNPYQGDF